MLGVFFFFKQKTAYEMRISDWSSDVCSSDLDQVAHAHAGGEHVGHLGIQVADQLRRLSRRVAVAGEAVGAQAPAQLQRAAGIVVELAAGLPVPGRQRPRRMRVGARTGPIADRSAERREGKEGDSPGGSWGWPYH